MGTTRHRIRRATVVGSGLTLALTLVACSDLSDDATRSGGTPPPVVLTIGTDDPPGRLASDQMAEFADQVASRSDGALRIELRHRAAGVGVDDWDQAVARLVVDGDLDLGMVPARAWDTEGVTSLRALTTPLLVTTDEHMDAVALDDELSRDLLSGLDEVGVTGLALVPEGIRYLMTAEGGPGVVDRLAAGGVVRSPLSETTWSFFEALGARPTDGASAGETVAAESQVALAGTLESANTLVGNLPLFAKLNSLVVNTEAFGELTGEQQDWLGEAAQATRDWAVDTRADDQELATAFCEDDGTIIHDTGAGSFMVTDAAAQVTNGLRSDPGTSALIDRVAALDGAASATPLGRCSPSPTSSPAPAQVTAETIVPEGGDLPDGTYRFRLTDDYLAAHGLNPENVAFNHGVWTTVLEDGRWTVDQVAPDITDHLEGVYQVDGRDLWWRFSDEESVIHLRWTVSDGGDLVFKEVPEPEVPDFQFDLEWQRVD